MPADLELDRAVVEDVRGMERARLQQQDREGCGGGGEKGAEKDELLPGPRERIRGRRPKGRHEQRGELRPAGERREDAAGERGGRQPEPPDQEERRQRVVRV